MRPLKLILEGFESYCNKTEIDFEKLGEKGLYLITGDTGAGKTTIFDAITFALYGEASGEARKTSMLRSSQADENVKTEVQLTFCAGGKTYKITRNPEYERKAKRGDGFTKQTAGAVLEYFDGRPPVDSVSKADKAIIDILKLKKEDFTQIAMIAQGDFEKFLLAPTTEKTKIFRNLFNTEKYEKLQTRLKEDCADLKKQHDFLTNSLEQYLTGIVFDENDVLNHRLLQLQETKIIDADAVEFLKEIVKKDQENLNKLTQELGEKSEKLNSLSESLGKVSEKKNTEEKLAENKNKYKSCQENLKNLEEALTRALAREKDGEGFEQEKILLEKALEEYKKTKELEKEIYSQKNQLLSMQKEIQEEENNIQQEKSRLSLFKKEFNELENAGENKALFESQQKELNEERKDLLNIQNQLAVLDKENNALEAQKKTAAASLEEWKKENQLFNSQKEAFYKNQAGILAQSLEEEKPCPVCGSVHHPSPACMVDEAPSQEMLEQKEKQVKTLEEKASSDSQAVKLSLQHIQDFTGQINESLTKYLPDSSIKNANADVQERIALVAEKLNLLAAQIQQETKRFERKTQLSKLIPQMENNLNLGESGLNAQKNKFAADNASLVAAEKKLKEEHSKLSFENEAEAQKKLMELASLIEDIKNGKIKAQDDFNSCKNEISALEGQIKIQEEQLKSFADYDAEVLEKEFNELSGDVQEITDKRDAVNSRLGRNKDNVAQICQKAVELVDVNEKYSMVYHLYETANGQIAGKAKVMLETFIQMNYLDQILIRANQKFSTMTDGVYELVRTEDLNGLRSQLGLDLSVKDYHSGTNRPVEGLSGGEKFQASLSLALGLADEIQEASKGIKLESMFIDEGFATLDPERLNKVMKALNDLSNNNKLIGMISHVGDLENVIPRHISVIKNSRGISTAFVELE